MTRLFTWGTPRGVCLALLSVRKVEMCRSLCERQSRCLSCSHHNCFVNPDDQVVRLPDLKVSNTCPWILGTASSKHINCCELSGGCQHARQAAVSARSLHSLHEPCLWVSRARSMKPTRWLSKLIAYVLGLVANSDVSPAGDLLPRHP
jgi:hypothetical protein